MRIVIVGAGAIGSYLAGRLSGEGQDVILIESDHTRARELQEGLDALVITGNGASMETLRDAGVGSADIFVAVSNSDGANVLACHNARELGNALTIARVEAPSLREGLQELGIDVVIDPSDAAALEIVRLVRRSGLSEIDVFADGRLALVGGVVQPAAPLAGATLQQLDVRNDLLESLVVALVRQGETIIARGDTVLRVGDRIFVMAPAERVDQVTALLGIETHEVRRAFIVGTTHLAELTLEHLIEEDLELVLIDHDPSRCRRMAELYPGVLVLNGDPADPQLLSDQHLGEKDVLLALTGWDEVNVMACLVGKALGASTTVARFHRLDHVDLLDGVGIDATVSNRLAAADDILRFVRGEHVFVVASVKHTEAEAFEIEVSGGEAVGKAVREAGWPEDSVVGGIVRDGRAFVPSGATVIREEDHVIVFALPNAIETVRRMLVR
jgi:trk system potassium uptake protein